MSTTFTIRQSPYSTRAEALSNGSVLVEALRQMTVWCAECLAPAGVGGGMVAGDLGVSVHERQARGGLVWSEGTVLLVDWACLSERTGKCLLSRSMRTTATTIQQTMNVIATKLTLLTTATTQTSLTTSTSCSPLMVASCQGRLSAGWRSSRSVVRMSVCESLFVGCQI
ncbi:hypothetical protein BC831DRAFT_456257 [Entophlyctis helioformis]|nr:hypothetical protein BC831DRAFT_456257 [Entophlyctis helioformis]